MDEGPILSLPTAFTTAMINAGREANARKASRLLGTETRHWRSTKFRVASPAPRSRQAGCSVVHWSWERPDAHISARFPGKCRFTHNLVQHVRPARGKVATATTTASAAT